VSGLGFYAGGTLGATTGTWANAPATFAYQWQSCDAMGAACVDATGPGASTASYTLVAADVGATMRVTVTAANAGGSASASAGATQVIVNPIPSAHAAGAAVSFTAATQVTLNKPALAPGEFAARLLDLQRKPGRGGPRRRGGSRSWPPTAPAVGPAIAVYRAIASANEPSNYPFSWVNAVNGGGATFS